ncbi:MAG TPA: glycosyltransferase [Candidatus Nanoarchaeia archaeon]|nr:glycosyltransferase [Candidatus Nanoarchaeia archaeon]
MKVISIGTDRNLFKEGSAVRDRQVEYGKLFDELHIIVFTTRGQYPPKIQLAPNVWVYATKSLSKLTYIKRAVQIASQIIREQKMSADDTVVSVQDPFESSIAGRRIKAAFGLPLHVQIHTDFLSPYFARESAINRIRVHIAEKTMKQADAVRVVSDRIAESLTMLEMKPGVVPAVLPIFVDVRKFQYAPPTVDLREKYSQFNFTILVASRLTREKNISFALDVFSRVLKFNPKAGLVIVGDGPEKSALRAKVKRLGISENVVFEDWQNDLTSYYCTANLFLLTSNYEGYGMTLVESVAAHCPAISTDVGIAKTLLQDGITLVCPIGDEDCFVEKISQLIDDPSLRLNFAQEADSRLSKVTISDKQLYLQAYKQNIESALG